MPSAQEMPIVLKSRKNAMSAAPRKPPSGNKKHGIPQPDDVVVPLHLPEPPKMQEIIDARQKQLAEYRKNRDGLIPTALNRDLCPFSGSD